MECNRDEAVRARDMAEQKFASKDYVAARKFALKAQQLFPSLENIAQMVAVMDVHVAAQSRVGSDERDWYGILQIEPTADDASVKRQYRKLALFLHPDKNKSIGAESAFTLIGEALQVLSDKVKRLVYDAKRGLNANVAARVDNPTIAVNGQCSQAPPQQHHKQPDASVQFNAFNTTSQQNTAQVPQSASVHTAAHLFTFWTACSSCQMRYQYFRKYENQNLLCPQCRRPFIAKDLSNVLKVNVTHAWPPQACSSSSVGSQTWSSYPYISTNFGTPGFTLFGSSFANGGLSGLHAGIVNQGNMSASAAATKNGVDFSHGMGTSTAKAEAEKEFYMKFEELRRAREIQKELPRKAKAAEKAQEALAKSLMKRKLEKKQKNNSWSESDEEVECCDKVTNENGKAAFGIKANASYNASKCDEGLQEMTYGKKLKLEADTGGLKQGLKEMDMNKRLAELARNAIRMQLNLQAAKAAAAAAVATAASASTCPPPANNAQEKNSSAPKVEKKHESSAMKKKQCNRSKPEDDTLQDCSVPDADFHNFDEGREEKDVEVGQIWALYDEKDGMPKYYVKVKEVRSRMPFKVLIGWFELRKPSEELYELLDEGFSFTCGEFRIACNQMLDGVNSFSHLVKWEKSNAKGMVKIYPRKGEIWSIFEDWEPGQRVFKISNAPLKYSMVEVLSDCNDEDGVAVVQLQKVYGFKTIFQLARDKILHIPFKEVLRFSHQVPAYKLRGDEAPGIPDDCWELDPAAVPFSLMDLNSNGIKTGN